MDFGNCPIVVNDIPALNDSENGKEFIAQFKKRESISIIACRLSVNNYYGSCKGIVDVVVTLTLLAFFYVRQDSRSGTLPRVVTAIMIIQ